MSPQVSNSDRDAFEKEGDGSWYQDLLERVCVLEDKKDKSDLIVMDGVVHGQKVKVLIDSGASRVYVAEQCVDRLGLAVSSSPTTENIILPNGSHVPIHGRTSFLLRLGTFHTTIDCRILNLPEFDIILGLQWLRAINPQTNWHTLEFKILDQAGTTHILRPGNYHRPLASDPGTVEMLNLILGSAARRAIRKKGTQAYLCFIKPVQPESLVADTTTTELPSCGDSELSAILKKYQHVFRSELPDHAPPERSISHAIDTGDAKPININAYPLSPIHSDEQVRQVETLLDKNLIRESSSPWCYGA